MTVQENDVNNSSGSTVISATLLQISYSQGTATYSYFINGSATATVQTIYYLNASSLIDSAVHQLYLNNAWATVERESYSAYNPDGNVAIADTTFYDHTTNALDSTSNNSIAWTGLDLTSYSDQNSNGNTYSATYTYYNKPPAKVVSLLSGPAYVKGVNLTNNWAETINTFINGNPFSNWFITYQTDDLNRTISTNFTINIISPASTFYEVTTFTYY